MLPNSQDVAEIESNITGETGQFTVDEQSLGKIMSVLTNLYSDPEGAVVREYLTNALDSQIEAQANDRNYVWRPVEVTTPSAFSKQYRVRDFGIGMTADDIRDTYSKYGKSTKENSQAVTGMLGLGSKCALTYTNSFTIVGFKNGVKTTALVSKNEDGIPIFQIVDTCKTNEPNGVEISVPVRDRNTFAQKTQALLRWWRDGQVLVDGKAPEPHGYEHIKNTPVECRMHIDGDIKTVSSPASVHLIERNRHAFGVPQSYVVMGNVPYTVDPEHVPDVLKRGNLGFVVFVPMGAVSFPPNRETLFYDTRTKKVLNDIATGLYDHLLQKNIDDIRACSSFKEAWTTWANVPAPFNNDPAIRNLQYKGHVLQSRIQHDHLNLHWNWQGNGELNSRNYVDISSWIEGGVVVTGVGTELNAQKPTSMFKKKVRHYIGSKNITPEHAMLVDKDVDSPWLAHLPRVKAEFIKQLKIPKDPSISTTPRAEAPFDYLWLDGATVKRDRQVNIVAAPGTKLVYISPADMRETYRKSGCSDDNLLRKFGTGCTLVVLSKNRFDKLRRLYPQAVSAKTYAQEVKDNYVKAMTPIDGVLSECGQYVSIFLKSLDPNEIDDPDIKALIKAANVGGTGNFEKALEFVNYVRRADIVLSAPEKPKANFNPSERYPLLDSIGYNSISKRQLVLHYTCYLNAVYKTLVKPKSRP